MKYKIGDPIIFDKRYKGLIIQIQLSDYIVGLQEGRWTTICCKEEALQTDLTRIEKPFNSLSEEIQRELKEIANGENIQTWSYGKWENTSTELTGNISYDNLYRLDPDYKEEIKEPDMKKELMAKVDEFQAWLKDFKQS